MVRRFRPQLRTSFLARTNYVQSNDTTNLRTDKCKYMCAQGKNGERPTSVSAVCAPPKAKEGEDRLKDTWCDGACICSALSFAMSNPTLFQSHPTVGIVNTVPLALQPPQMMTTYGTVPSVQTAGTVVPVVDSASYLKSICQLLNNPGSEFADIMKEAVSGEKPATKSTSYTAPEYLGKENECLDLCHRFADFVVATNEFHCQIYGWIEATNPSDPPGTTYFVFLSSQTRLTRDYFKRSRRTGIPGVHFQIDKGSSSGGN